MVPIPLNHGNISLSTKRIWQWSLTRKRCRIRFAGLLLARKPRWWWVECEDGCSLWHQIWSIKDLEKSIRFLMPLFDGLRPTMEMAPVVDSSLLPSFSLLTFSPSRSIANTHTHFLYRDRSMCSTPFLYKTTDSKPQSSGDTSTYLKQVSLPCFNPFNNPSTRPNGWREAHGACTARLLRKLKYYDRPLSECSIPPGLWHKASEIKAPGKYHHVSTVGSWQHLIQWRTPLPHLRAPLYIYLRVIRLGCTTTTPAIRIVSDMRCTER